MISHYLWEARRRRAKSWIRWIENREKRKAFWLTVAIFAVLTFGAIMWLVQH
jgi:hypothetical protein